MMRNDFTKLSDLIDAGIIQNTKTALFLPLDVGAKVTFTVEVFRGERLGKVRPEFIEWLKALDLEIDSIGVTGKDTCGNTDLLCIHCKPIKIKR